jgi:hypothetical protein
MTLIIGNKLKHFLYNSSSSFAFKLLQMAEIPSTAKLNYIEVEADDGKLRISYLADSRSSDNPFESVLRQTAKPVTVLKKLLPLADLPALNSWIDAMKLEFALPPHTIEIAKGRQLLDMYSAENYSECGGSTLGQSCMRYNKCQPYIEFYSRNNTSVSGVWVGENGLVSARALIWNAVLDRKKVTVLDRIYGKTDVFSGIIDEWSKSNCDFTLNHQTKQFRNNDNMVNSYLDLYVGLTFTDGPYPYLDNFKILQGKRLYNILHPRMSSRILTSTDGSYGGHNSVRDYKPNHVMSHNLGIWIPKTEAVLIKDIYVEKSTVVRCHLCDIPLEKRKIKAFAFENQLLYFCSLHVKNPVINNILYKACIEHSRLYTETMCPTCATQPRTCAYCYATVRQYTISNGSVICIACTQDITCTSCPTVTARYLTTLWGTDRYCGACADTWPRCVSCEGRTLPSELINDLCESCNGEYQECDNCSLRLHVEDLYTVNNDETVWCYTCTHNNTFYCTSCDFTCSNDNHSVLEETCCSCYEEFHYVCRNCNVDTVINSGYAHTCGSCVMLLRFHCSVCRRYSITPSTVPGICTDCTTPQPF